MLAARKTDPHEKVATESHGKIGFLFPSSPSPPVLRVDGADQNGPSRLPTTPSPMSAPDDLKSEDAALVAEARKGNSGAFERLIAKYEKSIFNIALYKSRNYFDAEDLAQDIFLAAYKALPSLRCAENFSSWLFGIAYNRCHKWFQRERTKVVKFDELRERAAREMRIQSRQARELPPRPSEEADSGPAELLRRVPPEIREVLKLKYLEGLSYQEIESRLGMNSNRIDYLIRKGKQLLRLRATREEHV